MTLEIRPMTADDYDAALNLWQRCTGMGLSAADEREPLSRFLEQNSGLSFVAFNNEHLVATCLCGTDGRRGFLYHLAVDPTLRRLGLGGQLVARVFAELARRGIEKCHIMVYAENTEGLAFWDRTGWVRRGEIVLMSKDVTGSDQEDHGKC